MLAEPVNDPECLGPLTTHVVESLGRPELRELAGRFDAPADVARWIRELPQRDDGGDPNDGPRIPCGTVDQRVRLPTGDPNCVERSLLYLALAELLQPGPVRQLVLVHLPEGPHVLPLEDGEPVRLDPRIVVTRNAVSAAVWRNARPPEEPSEAASLLRWALDIAREPAALGGELRRLQRVATVLENLIARVPAERFHSAAVRDDVAWLLSLAEEEADRWGQPGLDGIELARRALSLMGLLPARRNVKIRFRPKDVFRVAEQVALRSLGLGVIADELERQRQKAPAPARAPEAREREAERTEPRRTEPRRPPSSSKQSKQSSADTLRLWASFGVGV